MDINSIFSLHASFKEQLLQDRFFKHQQVTQLLGKLTAPFVVSVLGNSLEGRNISLVKWGNGNTKVMLWSQMHGDEATGTMALFDLFNFLQDPQFATQVAWLKQQLTLYVIPMVNPDGAERINRRNSQQIDINRDFLKASSAEARILKQCRASLQPHFGFNLHDQLTLWSVHGTLKPATLSFLAPAFDEALNINETREKAMLVIAQLFADLNPLLPAQIGLFDDEFEPRAFGDNFQKAGMATILIEAGGYANDFEKQEIRKYYFAAILSGLRSIGLESYGQYTLEQYFAIPKNNKQIFHVLIHNVPLNGVTVSIGINYEETPMANAQQTLRVYTIQDIGDLSFCNAYQNYAAPALRISGKVELFKNADFELFDNNELILSFQNGKLL